MKFSFPVLLLRKEIFDSDHSYNLLVSGYYINERDTWHKQGTVTSLANHENHRDTGRLQTRSEKNGFINTKKKQQKT